MVEFNFSKVKDNPDNSTRSEFQPVCFPGNFQQLLEQLLLKTLTTGRMILKKQQVIGNKAKGRISKRVFQESKARQDFRKTNISYLLIPTRTCAYQGVRNVCFSEIK